MTPMLADISTGELWMIALTGLMAVASLASTFWKKTDVNLQQPLNVEMVESLVSKEDFREHCRQNNEVHEQLFSKIGGMTRGTDSKISSEITAVHSRVNAIEKSIGGLEKATEIQNQQLQRMDTKIDRLIERHS